MTKNYDYTNMTLEQILAINEDENERYDMDRNLDDMVDSDKWNNCCGGRTTYGKNYEE